MSRVLVTGATGYIGRHVVDALITRGHDVVAVCRRRAGVGGAMDEARTKDALAGADVRFGDVTDPASLGSALADTKLDAAISCLASRSGAVEDSWAIEHRAQRHVLDAAGDAGATRFVLLSAICVQRPKLAFQRAKLAFEEDLRQSAMRWTIVRPTAFFKSLSGQLPKLQAGKPYVVFGDGELTACKPIAEQDLASYLVDCLEDSDRAGAILPIGGPGPAISPRAQGELLFELMERAPRYRRVPIGLMDAIIFALTAGSWLAPPLRAKAELARIGRYYATESMLVWDEAAGRYDADATPEHGERTLRDFYGRALREGLVGQELGDHAVF